MCGFVPYQHPSDGPIESRSICVADYTIKLELVAGRLWTCHTIGRFVRERPPSASQKFDSLGLRADCRCRGAVRVVLKGGSADLATTPRAAVNVV